MNERKKVSNKEPQDKHAKIKVSSADAMI